MRTGHVIYENGFPVVEVTTWNDVWWLKKLKPGIWL